MDHRVRFFVRGKQDLHTDMLQWVTRVWVSLLSVVLSLRVHHAVLSYV